MSRVRTMGMLAGILAVGSGSMTAIYGSQQGLWTALFIITLGGPALIVTHLLVEHRAHLGSLSRQHVLGVGLTISLALAGTELVAVMLLGSFHAAYTMAVLLATAAALGAYAAWFLSRRVAGDIGQVRDAVEAINEGDHSRRVDVHTMDEVAELGELVNEMTEQLATAEQQRSRMEQGRRDLLAAVSHDLRSPLSSLRILIEGLQGGFVSVQEQPRTLARLAFHIQSLDTLIEDLFELSRIEAGDIHWTVERVHLGEIVVETVEGVRAHGDNAGVAVNADLPELDLLVLANPEKIQRVLYNLLENAIAHSPRGSAVTVELRVRPDTVEIDVADQGSGVAPHEQERIFEPFFRGGPESSRPRDGAGLGLPICRAIIEAHHGQISLIESLDGTRVRFTLPRPDASHEDVEAARHVSLSSDG